MAKVLAIVVTYNAMGWIDKCITSLKESTQPVDILVIDNCSMDGTNEYVPDRYPEVTFLDSEENLGFGAANNLGLLHVLNHEYDFAYLMNQDAWVNPDTIEKLVNAWRPAYGILSPVQLNGKGRKMDKKFAKKCGKLIKKSPKDKLVVEVPFVMAAHWLVPRSAIETVGGFCPAFKQYGEDDNWIDRMHYFGFVAGVVRDAKAVHDRADRKTDKAQRMKLKCVVPVVKILNPAHSFVGRCFSAPLELLGMTIKNFSSIPVKYIPDFVKRYKEFRALRQKSLEKGAFLD